MINPTPAILSDAEFKVFQNLLIQESGIYIAVDRQETLKLVIAERMEFNRLTSVVDYLRLLTKDLRQGVELKCFIELLTIGETYFFRCLPQFHALQQKVLIPLIHERFSTSRTLTLWSAGCSTGEEPYSLAISLLETLPAPETWTISLLATDVNREAIRKAQIGVYNARSVHDIPPAWLKKYFTLQGNKYSVHEKVKRMVHFEYFNLAKDSFARPDRQGVDVLFCRNVMIYFPLTVTKRIIDHFYNALCEGGYFFIGGAETLWQISDRFTQVEVSDALVYRKEAPAAIVGSGEKENPITLPEPLFLQALEAPRVEGLAEAYALANEGRYAETIPILLKALEKNNLMMEAHYLLGIVYEKIGDLKKAQLAFQRVIYIDPRAASAYLALGNLYRYEQRYAKARREFENALQALQDRVDDEPMALSNDMTCGSLRALCTQSLEQINLKLFTSNV